MNISEANDLNTVLRYLLDVRRNGQPVARDSAREASARLADRARKPLGAGLDGDDVRELWGDVRWVHLDASLCDAPGVTAPYGVCEHDREVSRR